MEVLSEYGEFSMKKTIFNKDYNLSDGFALLLTASYCITFLSKKNIGGTVVLSEKCNKGLQSLLNHTYRLYMNFIGSDKREIPQFEVAEADITFIDEFQINWDVYKILLKETIGHSKGRKN